MPDLSAKMFLQHYGLRSQPFGVTPDPRFLFLTEGHRQAIHKLEFGIRCNRGFIALIAPPGLGKTTLLFYMLNRFRDSGSASTAFIFHTQCDSRELLRQVITDLGLEDDDRDLIRNNQRLHEYLLHESSCGRKVVLFIDEAQNLSEEALEAVRLLSNFETASQKLLQIVLAGQPPLASRLASPRLQQLRQRLFAMPQLRPLSEEEANAYIDHRLSVAGSDNKDLFTPGARKLLISLSKGIPREINSFCFNALAAGYDSEARSVDETVVRRSLLDATPREAHVLGSEAEFHSAQITSGPAAENRGHVALDRPAMEQRILRQANPLPSQNKDAAAISDLSGEVDRSAPDGTREALTRLFSQHHVEIDQVRQRKGRWYVTGLIAAVVVVLGLLASGLVYIVRSGASPAPESVAAGGPSPTADPVTTIPPKANLATRPQERRKGPSRRPKHAIAEPATPQDLPEMRAAVITAMSTSSVAREQEDVESADLPVMHTETNVWDNEVPRKVTLDGIDSVPDPANAQAHDKSIAESSPTLPSRTSGQLLYSARPEYPTSAIASRLEGTVVLKALISPEGRVLRLEKVSGSSVLADAAIQAVRTWRYRPATLDGKPIEVETWIALNFSLPKP